MEKEIKELTLLLLYLTSWQEKEKFLPTPLCRSWKGYDFDILNKLQEEGFLVGGRRSKSVYLTEEGIYKAKELQKKYKIGKCLSQVTKLKGDSL